MNRDRWREEYDRLENDCERLFARVRELEANGSKNDSIDYAYSVYRNAMDRKREFLRAEVRRIEAVLAKEAEIARLSVLLGLPATDERAEAGHPLRGSVGGS